MPRQDKYWYVATPYTKYKAGFHQAWIDATLAATELAEAGIQVFCPITHTHPMAYIGGHSYTDQEFYMWLDRPLMENAVGLIVVQLEGWDESVGVAEEIKYFKEAGKFIFYWKPSFVS